MKGIRTASLCRFGSIPTEDVAEREKGEGRQGATMTPRMAVMAQPTSSKEQNAGPTTIKRRESHGKRRQNNQRNEGRRRQKTR